MENLLSRLFDYQRYEGNGALAAVITEVHGRYEVRTLDPENMEYVSAAGIPDLRREKTRKPVKE